jgi:heme/copper-type cytochrome/quinol oxidase subunit 2
MNTLLLVMVWILSGLFVAFLMRITDESKGDDYNGDYWIKNRSYFFHVLILVVCAPLALLMGIIVMSDYCNDNFTAMATKNGE